MKKITLTTLLFIISLILFSQADILSSKPNTKESKNNARSFYLPFFEDWSSGSLETNNWQAETENWKINNQEGNERPSVEFDWSPLLEDDYLCTLESDQFNGEYYKVGRILLEYDIKLFDRNSTGDEKLLIEIFDGEEWNTVSEYSNDGSFEWESVSVEISEHALGNNFRIRFNAIGQDSYDIMAWYVDNIEVYRICDPPFDLDGSVYVPEPYEWGCQLWWSAPENTIVDEYAWVHWDSGVNDNVLGLTVGGDFSVAVRWENNELVEFHGDTIYSVRFFLTDSAFSEITVKLWTGENAETPIFSQQFVNPQTEAWNEMVLDTILFVDSELEYWVGYLVEEQMEGIYPSGLDKGPVAKHDANFIRAEPDSWHALEDVGINRNLNIQMKLLSIDTVSPGCTGFNIYSRDNDSYPEFEWLDFVDFVEGQNNYTYLDENLEDIWTEEHCYQVNAVWGSSGDTCISSFALGWFPLDNYICILASHIPEQNKLDILLSPNPVSSKLTITSGYEINEVYIADLQGQIIVTREINFLKKYQFDVSFLKPGFYILKVNTERGVITKKFLKTD